jgi:fibronectin type 3 domain-containing protein
MTHARTEHPVRRALGTVLALAAAALAGCSTWRLHWPSFDTPPAPARGPIELIASPPADLPLPEHVRAGDDGYRVIALQWEPLLRSTVAGYVVERAGAADGRFEPIATLMGRGQSVYVDDGGAQKLGDGVTAWYRLRPFASDGHLAAETSSAVAGSTAPLPDAPPALRAFSRQPREIPLAWHPSHSETAAGYAIERSPSEDGPYEVVARTTGRLATSYVDRDLGNLRVLYYRVASLTPSGASGPPSDPVRAVTKPEPLPPLGLHLATSALGRNVLAWDPNIEGDIAGYRLLRLHKHGRPTLVASVPADVTRAEDRTVTAGENARYAVVAIDRDGLESRPCEPIRVQSLDYDLEASPSPHEVALHWTPYVDEFPQARVSRTTWLGAREIGRTGDGRFVDADVAPGRAYHYIVVLIRSDGSEAPPSEPLEVHVPEDGGIR